MAITEAHARGGPGLRAAPRAPTDPGLASDASDGPDASDATRSRGGIGLGLLAALVGGLLLQVAFPPAGWWPLTAPAVALLVAACRALTVRWSALAGLLFGLAFFLPHLHWTGAVAGSGAWVALAVLQSGFLAALGAAMSAVARLPGWPVWMATLWVGEEALRSRQPFGGFPWGRLAFSQPDTPLTPLASIGGAPLVTFAVALLGALLVSAAGGRRQALTAVAVALGLVTGPALVPGPDEATTTRVAVVQGNVPRLGLSAFAQRAAVLANHVAATRQLAADVRAGRTARPDLVIWPENASDLDPYTDPFAARQIDEAVRDIGVPVLVGAVLQGPGDRLRNAGIVWDPASGPGETYLKQHLVPFGEYVPLRRLARTVTDKVDLVPRDFLPGERPGVLQVGPVLLGDVICFEVAYDSLVRKVVTGGGRLLVVQTNNATFGRGGETEQQLAMGRLRAVEHGRSLLVAATSGISAVIGPDGAITQQSGIFTREVLVAEVPVREGFTVATRLGGLPELTMCLLAAMALLLARLRR